MTTWCGQAQLISGIETIVMAWLLTSETDAYDDWHSTFINKDIFTRSPIEKSKIQENFSKGFKEAFPKAVKKQLK